MVCCARAMVSFVCFTKRERWRLRNATAVVWSAWGGWLVELVIGNSKFGRVLSMRSGRNRGGGGTYAMYDSSYRRGADVVVVEDR
jgi:hypothetical protein